MKLINSKEHEMQREDTETFEQLCEKGNMLIEQGDFYRAEIRYREAAMVSPDHPTPFVGLGVAATQNEDFKRALASFKTATKIDPECAEAYTGMAMVYYDTKLYPRAFEMYLKSLELDTDNMAALLGLFQTSCRMETFSKIIEYLEYYLKKNPDDHSVLFCLASLYHREGEYIRARQSLITVLAGTPNMHEAKELLADVDLAIKKHNQEVA